MKIWDFIKNKALANPEQTVEEKSESVTFKQLIELSENFAKELKGLNCCAIYCKSEMAAGMALLACFAADVTAVPLSERYGKLHCDKILDFICPDAIIKDNDGILNVYVKHNSKYIMPKEEPTLIMCTSGTTGIPKGVMLTDKNIITNVTDISEYFAIDSKDTILISRPLYHCAVLTGEFLTAIVKGSKIVFSSEPFNPPLLLTLINQYDITAICGTPTLIETMSRFVRKNQKYPLRHICISGECMSKATGLKISSVFSEADMYHIYGLTEACPRVSYLPPEKFHGFADTVGIPLKSVKIKIEDSNGTECAQNSEGKVFVKGANVMAGYYKSPKETDKVLKNGWLFTGDIGLITDEGFLKIKGRADDLIIKSGMNIYPAEIESVLKKDNRVTDVLAYGYDNEYGIQIGLKVVGDFKSVSEIQKYCHKLLPAFQQPTKIELVDKLKKNGSGKIMRRPLK